MPQAKNDTGTSRSAGGAVLEVQQDGAGQVWLELWTERGGDAGRAGARLVDEAVAEARSRRARRVSTALDAAKPSCGIVLDALRRHIGADVEGMATRRAGASVMVDLQLRP